MKWGVFDPKASPFSYSLKNENRIEITLSKLIEEYYTHTKFLHCHYDAHGRKFNIFIELNNFLKHNRYPLIKYRTEAFNGKPYAYSFYEIKRVNYKFLKKGVIYTIAHIDFDELEVAAKFFLKNNCPCEGLERKYLLPKLNVFRDGDLKVDGELYFRLDNVLMSRTRDSISIHTKDLCAVTGEFIRYLETKLDELFISSPEK